MADGPRAGLAILAPVLAAGTLARYAPLHVAHADLLDRAGDTEAATAAWARPSRATANGPLRDELERRVARAAGRRVRAGRKLRARCRNPCPPLRRTGEPGGRQDTTGAAARSSEGLTWGLHLACRPPAKHGSFPGPDRRGNGPWCSRRPRSFMVALDALVVITALPAYAPWTSVSSVSTLEWTVNAYTLSFAAGIITAAALGDRLGRRRVYVAGLLIFTAASAACALAPSARHPDRGRRRVQGIGARRSSRR